MLETITKIATGSTGNIDVRVFVDMVLIKMIIEREPNLQEEKNEEEILNRNMLGILWSE